MQSVSPPAAQNTPTAAADTAADGEYEIHMGSRGLPAGWKDAALFACLFAGWLLTLPMVIVGGAALMLEFTSSLLRSSAQEQSGAYYPVFENAIEAVRFADDAGSEWWGIVFLFLIGYWVVRWRGGVTRVEIGARGLRLTRHLGRKVTLAWRDIKEIKRKAFAANSLSVLGNYRITGAGGGWRYAPADALSFEAALTRLRPAGAAAARSGWARHFANGTRDFARLLLLLLCVIACFVLLLSTIKFIAEPADSGTAYLNGPLQRLFLLKPSASSANVQPALLVNGVKAGELGVVRSAMARIDNLREVKFKAPVLDVAMWGRTDSKRGDGNSSLRSAPLYDLLEAQRRAEIIRILIAHGAHVDPGTLLTAALSKNRLFFAELLAAGAPRDDVGPGGIPDVAIAARESLAALTLYLDAKADPDQGDDAGQTPLMIVARSSGAYEHKRKAMELLLARGAHLDAQDSDGNTLAHALVAGGDAKLLVEWIDRGGGYGARSKRGETLMHIAAMSEKISIIQQLIKSGLNVRVTDNNGATPLHRARGAAVVAFLVTQGADVNARDNRGRTSLHEAVRMRAWDAVAALIKSGARKDVTDNVDSVDSADRGGKTPLDYFNEQLGGMAKPPRNRDELIKLLTP